MNRPKDDRPMAYIPMPLMSGMPPPPGAGASSFSGMSVIKASVVRIMLATEAAFCKALRVTFTGSKMPILSMSPNLRVAALKP